MGKFVRTLTITYDLDIDNWEVPLFRGAVVDAIGSSANLLFHNHTPDDGLRYSYPLIQYKRQGGKACIIAVEQGVNKFYRSHISNENNTTHKFNNKQNNVTSRI